MVLSLAVIGFIWPAHLLAEQGLINNILGHRQGNLIDWLGNPSINLWAVLVAAGWRHAGYIMILYLAGLKSVDPSLREAAAIDGAGEWHAFRTVVFPALKPINIVGRRRDGDRGAAGVRHRLHHQQRPQRARAAVGARDDNIIGEASRIGYGSAIAVILLVIALVPIIIFVVEQLPETSRRDERHRHRGHPSRARRRPLDARRGSALHAFLIVAALFWLAPVAWAVYTSLRPYSETAENGYVSLPDTLTLENYTNAWTRATSRTTS